MDTTTTSWQESLSFGANYTVAQFATFLPRIVGAVVVLLVGLLVARIVRRLIVRALEAMRVSKAVEHTPLELFLHNAEVGQKLEDIIGGVFYWLFLFVVLHTSVSVLGLTPLSELMGRILDYLPRVFSAILVFLLGVLLAGVVESVVKGGMRSLDSSSSRLFARAASYAVVIVASLAAIAELGIATQFISILFMGVVFALSLGAGLAFGLGGQDTVRKALEKWNKKIK